MDIHDSLATEWVLPGKKNEQRDSSGPDVCLPAPNDLVGYTGADDFGCIAVSRQIIDRGVEFLRDRAKHLPRGWHSRLFCQQIYLVRLRATCAV